LKSSSVSPGKPTISDVRRAISGISERILLLREFPEAFAGSFWKESGR
jgi:hypothetical protein